MTQRALITGAGGFAGQRLTRLLRDGGWEVVPTACPAGPEMVSCDVTDGASIEAALTDAGEVTHVFHLGAITFVPHAEQDPLRAMEVNLNGTIRLCEALRSRPNAPRFVFISTGEVYGPPVYVPVDEKHPLQPGNVYAISKAAADHYCARLGKAGALDIVRIRAFNHSGPGQSDDFVLSSFARQIAAIDLGQAEPVVRVGNLEAARDFLHVDDVLRAYVLAAEQGVAGEVYNVCAGRSYKIQEALDQLLAMSSVAIKVERDPARMRPSDVPEVRGTHEKLTAATGWEPEIAFEDLLRDLMDHWRTTLSGDNPIS